MKVCELFHSPFNLPGRVTRWLARPPPAARSPQPCPVEQTRPRRPIPSPLPSSNTQVEDAPLPCSDSLPSAETLPPRLRGGAVSFLHHSPVWRVCCPSTLFSHKTQSFPSSDCPSTPSLAGILSWTSSPQPPTTALLTPPAQGALLRACPGG